MKIRPIVEQIKNGDKEGIELLINYYYPIFLRKAYKNKPDYYMPDRVKQDVTEIITSYFDNCIKYKFTDYINSKLEKYCNKTMKKFFHPRVNDVDPLIEVEQDEHYINIIYENLVNPSTKILNKEEKIDLSYMMYFNIKNSYYSIKAKTSFPVHICNYIRHFVINVNNFTLEDRIMTMYIYLIGIKGSLKEYCQEVYKKICNKYEYEYKDNEFIEFINEVHISDKKQNPISLTSRIEKFILSKKKENFKQTKKELEKQDNYELTKTRIFEKYKNSGIDEILLLDYMEFYYDEIVEEYNNKEEKLKSSLKKCISTKLTKGVKTLIIKDEESKNIIRDIIKNKNLPKNKVDLLELMRLSVLRKFYISSAKNPSPRKFNDTILEQALYVIFSDDEEELEKELI